MKARPDDLGRFFDHWQQEAEQAHKLVKRIGFQLTLGQPEKAQRINVLRAGFDPFVGVDTTGPPIDRVDVPYTPVSLTYALRFRYRDAVRVRAVFRAMGFTAAPGTNIDTKRTPSRKQLVHFWSQRWFIRNRGRFPSPWQFRNPADQDRAVRAKDRAFKRARRNIHIPTLRRMWRKRYRIPDNPDDLISMSVQALTQVGVYEPESMVFAHIPAVHGAEWMGAAKVLRDLGIVDRFEQSDRAMRRERANTQWFYGPV